jgi:hypothetical protein
MVLLILLGDEDEDDDQDQELDTAAPAFLLLLLLLLLITAFLGCGWRPWAKQKTHDRFQPWVLVKIVSSFDKSQRHRR